MFQNLFKKKLSINKSAVITFAKAFEVEYVNAYKYRNMKYIAGHISRELYYKVLNNVKCGFSGITAPNDFKTITWTVLTEIEGVIVLKKEVLFDPVKLRKAVEVKVDNDFTELWSIIPDGLSYKLIDIEIVKI